MELDTLKRIRTILRHNHMRMQADSQAKKSFNVESAIKMY